MRMITRIASATSLLLTAGTASATVTYSITNLGTLNGSDSSSLPQDINDAGQVTGSSFTGAGAAHAFVYSPGSGMADIGALGGGRDSVGYGINAAGDVVGVTYLGPQSERAFLYSAGVLHDLIDLIDPLSGWTLSRAQAINIRGQITGLGVIGGHYGAFLLTPNAVPEPASCGR